MSFNSSYSLLSEEKLENISHRFDAILTSCVLCPRQCRVNRVKGDKGFCGSGVQAKIASYNLHFGEEPPISGTRGSGTIFFSGCTLKCLFCQNYPISHLQHGEVVDDVQLADWMVELQNKGAHNINLVTPTHFLPACIRAFIIARKNKLHIPIVYNSSGYERVEILRLLKDIVDIYMPDAKYATESAAQTYSDAADYPLINRAALKEMYRQTGDLKIDKDNVATRGLLVRHLVLPNNIKETEEVLAMLKKEISSDIYLSLMSQYHPAYKSHRCDELNRCVNRQEYQHALRTADQLGLQNGWRQSI